ncbi:DUF2515 family protein [Sulfuriferula thiophila]|uniref:DUF2515 family protein n=1 Tax=Sulfuriferula thiophila TaxID=1781211 RepID=UPI000F60E6CE|nr:hypothetical protein [Sulfuriferula thiophila]
MSQCFKDHECDEQELHKNTKPISECKSYFTEENGRKVKITEVPILGCECIWRTYQKEAEDIVAPGGKLIANPVERNKRINAAYAALWLDDHRFQWAGLAAFASKQVGCGLLHAADSVGRIQKEHDAAQRMTQSAKPIFSMPGLNIGKVDDKAQKDWEQARQNNPIPTADVRRTGETYSAAQQQFMHVYDMLALGNTTLFLDVFPLHAFYKKRGLQEFKQCFPARKKITDNPKFPVLWPIGGKVQFGQNFEEILQAFEAIEAGQIATGVEWLARHEQKNILQPAMYSNPQLVTLLRGNHAAYVTDMLSGVPEAVQVTLASECRLPETDPRTVGFGNNPLANLADLNQRMPFVLRAAKRFDDMLHNLNRSLLEQSLQRIAAGHSVR